MILFKLSISTNRFFSNQQKFRAYHDNFSSYLMIKYILHMAYIISDCAKLGWSFLTYTVILKLTLLFIVRKWYNLCSIVKKDVTFVAGTFSAHVKSITKRRNNRYIIYYIFHCRNTYFSLEYGLNLWKELE